MSRTDCLVWWNTREIPKSKINENVIQAEKIWQRRGRNVYWKWMKWSKRRKRRADKSKSQRTIIFMKTPTDRKQIVRLEFVFQCNRSSNVCGDGDGDVGIFVCMSEYRFILHYYCGAVKFRRRCVDYFGLFYIFFLEILWFQYDFIFFWSI